MTGTASTAASCYICVLFLYQKQDGAYLSDFNKKQETFPFRNLVTYH